MIPVNARDIERFWSKVSGMEGNECWEWTGALDSGGYGGFWCGQRQYSAHRAVYEICVGAIPSGMCICHKCDNRKCVNPSHLFLGTHCDNFADATKKGRLGHSPTMYPGEVWLMRLLKCRGMSYENIARMFCCGRETVRRYVTGIRVPKTT